MITALLAAALAASSPQDKPLGLSRSVDDICMFVAENPYDELTDMPPPHTGRVYRTLMLQAAGVKIGTDDAETIRIKMQRWWTASQDKLLCNVANSIVRDGSILRLAVDRSNSDFINDAARRWRVDLNYRDKTDGGTVLDFIDGQMKISEGTGRFDILRRYRTILEGVGAKRAKDLP